MSSNAPFLITFAIFGCIIALCLFGISRLRNRKIHERGHLAFSFLPWLHLLLSYAIAVYIRIGFGSWARCCTDNPDLLLLDGLVTIIAVGLLILPLGIPIWTGWLIIRIRRTMNRFWIPSTVLFITGIVLMITAQVVDLWGFWGWFWD